MKKSESFFLGLTVAIGMALVYTSFQSVTMNKREIASLKTSVKQIPKLKGLEETVQFIVKNQLSQVEYSGTLIKEDIDLLKSHQYIERYYIENDRERIRVNPVNKEELFHLHGKEVVLTGWNDPSGKIIGHVGADQPSEASNRLSMNHALDVRAIRYDRMLVVWADFNDSTPLPEGPEWASLSNIGPFLNSKTFQSYFNDVYQGKLINKITKVVPYRFRRNCADKMLPGHPGVEGYVDSVDVNTIFAELNLNPRDYANVSVLANCNGNSAWGVGSGAVVDGIYLTTSNLTMWPSYFKFGSATDIVPYLPIPEDSWTFLDAFIHERLHTLGHPHANSLDCGTSDILFPCTHKEYGNPFDVMGSRNPAFYLNANLMRRQKVRPESQYLTIEKPGIYSIDNLESTAPNPIIAAYIKIPEVSERVFMVEHRQPVSYDRNLMKPAYNEASKGLLLYSSILPWGNSAQYAEYDFRLIDPYPGSEAPIFDRLKNRSIVSKRPYFDPMTGVRISVIEPNIYAKKFADKRSITFRVDFDEKQRVCFKARLQDAIEPLYFVVNNQNISADTVATLRPGDVFHIKGNFHKFDPSFCPGFEIKTVISNTSMITSWQETKPQGCNSFLCPEFRPGPTGGNGGGDIGGGDDGGYDPSTPTIEYTMDNMDIQITLSGNMIVPEDAPAGYYELPVKYTSEKGESFESTMKFRIVKDAPKALSIKKLR